MADNAPTARPRARSRRRGVLYPGEPALMANAHALEEDCRPIVEEMIRKGVSDTGLITPGVLPAAA